MIVSWAALAASIVASMLGQTLLKSGAGAPSFAAQMLHWHSLVGLVVYAGAAILYMIALRRIPMSVALPCTAVTYIFALLIGHYAFGEPIVPVKLLAILLIGTGVILLAAV
jgi:multidrug transporter EmrE-like cation transporter